MSTPTFSLKTLAVAVASFSMASVAGAAGLDRSGQDVSAFLQDGTYAEAVYTYIDADVTGYDNAAAPNPSALNKYEKGNELSDIAESYDFFRYGVKTDVNDTFSVGVLYDEPFGAAAVYSGNNDFTGTPEKLVNDVLSRASQTVSQATNKTVNFDNVAQLDGYISQAETSLEAAEKQLAAGRQQLEDGRTKLEQAQQAVAANPALEPILRPEIEAGKAEIEAGEKRIKEKQQEFDQGKQGVAQLQNTSNVIQKQLTTDEATNVEVRTFNTSLIGGVKLGQNKQIQVYGGSVMQRVQADVHLRGDAYGKAAGYDAHIIPDNDFGWLAGVSYSKPEIGLKAALTYRSEIEHNTTVDENLPALALLGQSPRSFDKIKITTPESFNFDFQTGINPTTLATAKVRYVPWSDFAIVPPAYNNASKNADRPDGLPLVSYDKDQWQVELGLAKRLTPALAVSGNIGWDSGAGNPVTSLGPIEGYYSVGAGAKYNLNKNWAISAGGKYLMFGDAKGVVPTGQVVSNFEDNNGYVLGVKLSYQDK